MKQVKNYLDPDVAKRKIARFQFWSIKDESGVIICSATQNNPGKKSFDEMLEQIVEEDIDAEVQIRYGSNEQSSRNNPPFFIKINDNIEWINPEPDEKVTVNGIPQKPNRNSNVNINLSTPKAEQPETPDWRNEMEIQLKGLRQEYELKNEQTRLEMQNKILEQTMQFKNMLLEQKENELRQREAGLDEREAELEERITEIQDNLKGYFKEIPSALAGLFRDFIKKDGEKENGLGGTSGEPKNEGAKKRTPVEFRIKQEKDGNGDIKEEQEANGDENKDKNENDFDEDEIEAEIAKYEAMEENELSTEHNNPDAGNEENKENNVQDNKNNRNINK